MNILLRYLTLCFSFALAGSVVSCSKTVEKSASLEKIQTQKIVEHTTTQLQNFSTALNHFESVLKNNSNTTYQLQKSFLDLRLAYKPLEWAVTYFLAATTRTVNGAPVSEVEQSEQGMIVFPPGGLQVIEDQLFPDFSIKNTINLEKEITQLRQNIKQYQWYFKTANFTHWQLIDAFKQEVFRVETLGITGFDNPLTLQSMQESAAALSGMLFAIKTFPEEDIFSLKIAIEKATKYLKKNTNFNDFDRAYFIRHFANPISTQLTELQQKYAKNMPKYNRLLQQNSATLFQKNAFNKNAYLPYPEAKSSPEKIALGKKLFFDPALSNNHSRSCATCHQPEKAFTDGLSKNMSLQHHKMLPRNTPTLLNAALQPAQFYDLRALTLEDQITDVFHNPEEMGGDFTYVLQQISKDTTYKKLYIKAYPNTSIDSVHIKNALASYVRSLSLLNSRFDDYMRGDSTALQETEIKGFNIFMGKAKCATCHYMPLFNGAFPPKYYRMETEVLGVPATLAYKKLDSDLGRAKLLPTPELEHSFKTTTVRNSSNTAPYMHNGIFKTLEEVIDFYNNGGGIGHKIDVPNQTLPSDSLHLSSQEKSQLIAFIKSLNSKY
ncbi:cytochrome-c peroxidase [Zhouia sp. PK063]|uniref:cytochrome-c peroxidase n=1 Tax=Zhouia sp. PK063 TaxID=3373602 RepID=UPI0037A13A1F